MNFIFVMRAGEEKRDLKIFQFDPGGQHVDTASIARLGFTVDVESQRPDLCEIVETEKGRMMAPCDVGDYENAAARADAAGDDPPPPFLLIARLKNTAGAVVAMGALLVWVVDADWREMPDLMFGPAPEPGEPKEPSRLVLP